MKHYITTTLPYANAQPHLGHAIEFVQADVIARALRIIDETVFLNVGTDEHGLKMYQKATEQGVSIENFIRDNRQHFIDFCKDFDVEYDNFYATSNATHHDVAQALWKACEAAGDIYKKKYTGQYCIGCESFKTPKDLVDGLCPDHGVAPVDYAQENYFFKMSRYRDQLLAYIDNTSFVSPNHKNNELRNFVADMEDISISRTRESLPRGVPVPGDDSQVMYVRFDALSNYVGAVGYPDNEQQFADRWSDARTLQLCGPDNLRFQGAIRQAMLASAGIAQTDILLVHGMILGSDGAKMSKTLGNVISPMDQKEKYGLDAFRYYLIAGIPTTTDASYKEDDLVALHNSHLANTFGNLLNRVLHLATKKSVDLMSDEHTVSDDVHTTIDERFTLITNHYKNYSLSLAAAEIHELAQYANEYLSAPERAPWNKELDEATQTQTLIDVAAMIDVIITRYRPIMPTACDRARQMLDSGQKGILFERIEISR